MIRSALKQAGVPAGEAGLVLMPPVDAALAFRSGAVDAWAVWDPYVSLKVLQFGARVLVDGRGLTPEVMLVAAHNGAIAAKDAALVDFLGRFRAAWAWADGHIPEYARYNSALTGLPEPVLRRTYETERSRPVAVTVAALGAAAATYRIAQHGPTAPLQSGTPGPGTAGLRAEPAAFQAQ